MSKGNLIWRTNITVTVTPEYEEDEGVRGAAKMLQEVLMQIAGQYSKAFMFLQTGEEMPIFTGGCELCGGLGFTVDEGNATACSCVEEVG